MTEDEEWTHLLAVLAPYGWKVETAEESELLTSASDGLFMGREQLREPARTWLFASLKRRFLSTRRHLPEISEDHRPRFLETIEETRQLWNALVSLGSVPDLIEVAPDLAAEDDPS